MTKKLGILTMRYTRNYGGVLQCVALFNILKNKGFDVEIIDYAPALGTRWKTTLTRGLHSIFSMRYICKKIMGRVLLRKKKTAKLSDLFLKNFEKFKADNLKFTQSVDETTIGQVVLGYAAIVVGSDQIWNGLDRNPIVHLFDWKPEYPGIRVSYAPCSTSSNISFFRKHKINACLQKIHGISVRDSPTQQLVENNSGISPEIVADPTCLYDFDELIEEPDIEEPYIFSYLLSSEIAGGHKAVLERIKEKHGEIKVYAIVISDVSLEVESFADKVFYDASPQKWLSLLAHSKFVYTDSFHGCIFSMKFQKPFLAYYKEGSRSSRLLDLANRFEIDGVIVNSVNEMIKKRSIENGVDYEVVNKRMIELQDVSLEFLAKNLEHLL